jgi:hypothetical protein
MQAIIKWILTNVFLWTAVVAIIIGWFQQSTQLNRSALVLRQLLLWFGGIAFFYSGSMHVFFADFTAEKIGWANSPFQFEVGLANFSAALICLMAYFQPHRYYWLATILSLAIFSCGAGFGHVYQLLYHHNHAGSNSGTILYTDILVPLIMLGLWFFSRVDQETV